MVKPVRLLGGCQCSYAVTACILCCMHTVIARMCSLCTCAYERMSSFRAHCGCKSAHMFLNVSAVNVCMQSDAHMLLLCMCVDGAHTHTMSTAEVL